MVDDERVRLEEIVRRLEGRLKRAEAELAGRLTMLQVARRDEEQAHARLALRVSEVQPSGPRSRPWRLRAPEESAVRELRRRDRAVADVERRSLEVETAQRKAAQIRADLEEVRARGEGSTTDREVAPVDLRSRPPATSVGEVDLGAIGRDLELLLAEAERYAADEGNPPELRDAVHVRRLTLLGEIRLVGVDADSQTIVRAAAFLISVLAPAEVLAQAMEAEPASPTAQVSAVVGSVPGLGDEASVVAAGEDIAARLDALTRTEGTARDALRRGAHQWLEHDLWGVHVNRIATAATAGAVAAGGLAAEQATGGRLSAILRAVVALMRARFPWIFP